MSNIIDGFFDQKMYGLQQLMSLSYRRNEAIVSNITNAETPGYRATDLSFAGELERALSGSENSNVLKTNPMHMDTDDNSFAHLIEDLSGHTKADGNNVDVDVQMGKLSQNSGQYGLATDIMRKKVQLLKTALRAGAR